MTRRIRARLTSLACALVTAALLAAPASATQMIPDPVVLANGNLSGTISLIDVIAGASFTGGTILAGAVGASDTVLSFRGDGTGALDILTIAVLNGTLPTPSAVGVLASDNVVVTDAALGLNELTGPTQTAAILEIDANSTGSVLNFFVAFPTSTVDGESLSFLIFGIDSSAGAGAVLTPEPATAMLMGMGLLGMLAVARRRSR